MSVSNAVVNGDSGTSIGLVSLPLSPIMVPTCTCTTLPSVSISTTSTLSCMYAQITSRNMFSSVGARPTLGADTQAVPSPSFVSPIEMRPSVTMMEAGTWGASRSQLDSDRHWTELPAVRITVSSNPSSLCLTNVSFPLTVSVVPSTTSLSVLTTPFLPSCVPTTIGMLPSVSSYTTQSGDHVLGSSRHGRCLVNEATVNPQPVTMQTPYLLGQQLPPISKFSGEDLDGDGEIEWVEQFELVAGMCG